MYINNMNGNIKYLQEDNFSVVDKNTDVWDGELPFKSGDVFPTKEIKDRAMISYTNKLIYNNDIDRVFADILSIFPEIDPMYGWQIREIIANLPYFNNTTNYWVSLIAGEPPTIDGDDDIDLEINGVIENSNWSEIITNEVRSRFMDIISAYRVDVDINGKPTIVAIEPKNLICYISKRYITSIEVSVVFNIYTDKRGKQFVEFIEYHYDGKIKKTVFEYTSGKLGRHLEELDEESEAFNGKFKMSPIVVAKHNTVGNQIYGTDQYRYWSAGILGAMRALQNIFRLGERTREMVREVPDTAISKDSSTGESVYFNKGTIAIPVGQTDFPRSEYKVPEIRMDEAIKVLDKAIKNIGSDTKLGAVFFELEKLGTNLSAKSIEAALYPTKVEAKRMANEMTPFVKELVVKLCALVDIDISNNSKFSVNWYDGFPKDMKEYTDAIQKRLGDKPSISTVDAIRKLDKVSSRVAMQKAREIEEENGTVYEDESTFEEEELESNVDDKLEEKDINTHEIVFEVNEVKGRQSSSGSYADNTVWETQMYPTPRDVIGRVDKGVSSKWVKRQLRKNRMK